MKTHRYKGILLILLCGLLFISCAPASQTGVGTTTTNDSATTTVTQLTTTSEQLTTTATDSQTTITVVPRKTTTTTTVKEATTSVSTTQASRTTKPSQVKVIADSELIFPYESEDYDVLRQVILEEFPEEQHLDDCRIVKDKYVTPKKTGEAYFVTFNRVINGCWTDIMYVLYFDENGKHIKLRFRNPVYNPTAVKPPRVATEAEIEQAKEEAAAKVPDDCMVWEQTVGPSSYSVNKDHNYFNITTVYAYKSVVEEGGYLDPNSPNYGKEPPHAADAMSFEIVR